MAAQPDSEPRSLAAALQFLAVRVSPTVWKRSFSFSSFPLATLLSREIFSVLDAQLLPEFRSALEMLPSLKISWFLVLMPLLVFPLEWATPLSLPPKVS